jgi:hypothetical protein
MTSAPNWADTAEVKLSRREAWEIADLIRVTDKARGTADPARIRLNAVRELLEAKFPEGR